MFASLQFRCEPLMLLCLRVFILSCFLTPTFLLLHFQFKTSFTSLAFLSCPFQGVSSEIITLLNTISIGNPAKYVTAQLV